MVFWCNPGFVPDEVMTAVCGRDGQWTPNPGDVTCTPRLTPTFTLVPTPTRTSTRSGENDTIIQYPAYELYSISILPKLLLVLFFGGVNTN